MNSSTSYTEQLTDALVDATTQAVRHAPSVLNTQPWHWHVHAARLELFADRSRQLSAMDPDGRQLMLSCGVVLDHVRVALAAQGWASPVRRSASAGERVRLHVLFPDQVLGLPAAASRALTVSAKDAFARAELDYWTSRTMPEGSGLPTAVLPDHCPQTTVPGRRFGHPGTLPIGSGHDRAAMSSPSLPPGRPCDAC